MEFDEDKFTSRTLAQTRVPSILAADGLIIQQDWLDRALAIYDGWGWHNPSVSGQAEEYLVSLVDFFLHNPFLYDT